MSGREGKRHGSRSLRSDAWAISAVLSTALLVGVTIALAFGVAVFVHVLSSGQRDAPPNLALAADESADTLQYVRSTASYDLSKLHLGMSVAGHWAFNGEASSSSPAIAAGTRTPVSDTPGGSFAPGDLLSFCADVASDRVTVMLVHQETGTLLLRHTFEHVAACA